MSTKKKNKKGSRRKAVAANSDVSLADLNELHTQTHNLFMDTSDPDEEEELRLLLRMLSRRIRKVNDAAIQRNVAAYKVLAKSFDEAKKAAEEALRDLQKVAAFIDDLADVVSKLGKIAAAAA